MKPEIVVALAGNPNAGKTTVFNELTGSRQHVGNYPGVTVECKEGFRRHGDVRLRIVDLPGIYSLTAYSAEELVARNFIIDRKPDVVVDILDASNLERNLYLAVQLMELAVPLVLVFNMSDVARAKGYEFDIGKLERFFGASIVQTTGNRGEGMTELLDAAVRVAGEGRKGTDRPPVAITYGKVIEEEIARIAPLVEKAGIFSGRYDARWVALKLLENDGEVQAAVESADIAGQVAKSAARIVKLLGEPPETAIAGERYGFISGACQEAVRSTIETRHTTSDQIDAVVTHPVFGIPLFLGLMYLVFNLTFTVGEPPMGWIEAFFGWLGGAVGDFWPEGRGELVKSLLVDGVIGGVGGVVVFLPNILLLFLAIAVLEYSGYMARAAFLMDNVMHRIGLHGKSFIPMLIGFGCSIPAIMATRTLDNRRDRLTTMLVLPLISCGARLTIYALIIPAFFPPSWQAPVLWIVYVIGILLAVAGAKLLRGTIFKGESVPFVMELPPYRMPTLKAVLIHMWDMGWQYLRKAGTVILGISILLWALSTFPGLPEGESARFREAREAVGAASLEEGERAARLASIDNEEAQAALLNSFAGRIGKGMEPVLAPMGFDWRIGVALIGAFAAKEVFVAQMGIVHSVGEADERSETLREKLRENYSPLVGFCIMIFCLIAAPCMATVAVTSRESGSWRWGLFQLAGLTVLGYVVTVVVFQIGSFLRLGTG